jgi:hypothetical protein
MTRSRKLAQPKCGCDRRSLSEGAWLSPVMLGLTAFVVLCLLFGSPVYAASPTGQTTSTQTTAAKGVKSSSDQVVAPGPITPYVSQGYSITGPVYVSAISPQSIGLNKGRGNVGIDLLGKSVSVIDQNYKPLTLSAVKKGSRVYVCRKGNSVVVMVIPVTAATGGAKK